VVVEPTYEDAIRLCGFRLLRCVWFYVPPDEAQHAWRAMRPQIRQHWAERLYNEAMRRRDNELARRGYHPEARNLGDMVAGEVARPASETLTPEQNMQLNRVLLPWAAEQSKGLPPEER
jgi:hypothetical protein